MTDEEQLKIFAENISRFSDRSGKTRKEIAKELGFNEKTYSGWCNGLSIPTMGKVQKIADYFGVGKSALLDKYSDKFEYNLTAEECRIINEYRKSSEDIKNAICSILHVERTKKKILNA